MKSKSQLITIISAFLFLLNFNAIGQIEKGDYTVDFSSTVFVNSNTDTFVNASVSGNYMKLITKDIMICLLYTSPSPRDRQKSRMPSSA